MKIKEYIEFDEFAHTYTNLETSDRYKSVTTVLNKYKKKFEGNTYQTSKTAKNLNLTHEEVLKLWEVKRDTAARRGTLIHACLEEFFIQYAEGKIKGKAFNNPKYVNSVNALIEKYDNAATYEAIKKYVYFVSALGYHKKKFVVEDILWDNDIKIAGQSDLVIFNSRPKTITIADYKTNLDELTFTGYNKMLAPFDDLMDSKLQIYELQLSIYGYFAEKYYGIPVSDIVVIHLGEKMKVIPLTYRKDLVLKLYK
jgi:hypothetical protein